MYKPEEYGDFEDFFEIEGEEELEEGGEKILLSSLNINCFIREFSYFSANISTGFFGAGEEREREGEEEGEEIGRDPSVSSYCCVSCVFGSCGAP